MQIDTKMNYLIDVKMKYLVENGIDKKDIEKEFEAYLDTKVNSLIEKQWDEKVVDVENTSTPNEKIEFYRNEDLWKEKKAEEIDTQILSAEHNREQCLILGADTSVNLEYITYDKNEAKAFIKEHIADYSENINKTDLINAIHDATNPYMYEQRFVIFKDIEQYEEWKKDIRSDWKHDKTITHLLKNSDSVVFFTKSEEEMNSSVVYDNAYSFSADLLANAPLLDRERVPKKEIRQVDIKTQNI